MGEYKLVICFSNRIISIPFPSIENLDGYTAMYDNMDELGEAIIKLLNLEIDNPKVIKCYVTFDRQGKQTELPVKYSGDNFELEDVQDKFATYFDQNPDIINEDEGLRRVVSNFLRKVNRNNLLRADVLRITKSYINTYRRSRDIYFKLRDKGYRFNITKPNIVDSGRSDLNKYTASDSHMDSLLGYGLKGSKEHDRAMEELSFYDIDELNSSFRDNEETLFDGMDRKKITVEDNDEEMVLEGLTRKSLEELKKLLDNYNRGNNGRNR